MSITVEDLGHAMLLRRRLAGWGQVGCTGLFLGAWLTGWTAGCVFLLRMVLQNPTLQHVLFAVPFVVAWFAVAAFLIYLLLGRETLLIDRDGVAYERRALIRTGHKTARLDEVLGVRRYVGPRDSDSGRQQAGLAIDTQHGVIRFGKGLSKDELSRLAEQVADRLARLRPAPLISDAKDAVDRVDTPAIEVFQAPATPVDRPAATTLQLTETIDGFELLRRGRWSPSGVFGTLFICAFWNGIVSVFILQLIKDFDWFLFFFLIPFEVIGVLFLLMFLAMLAGPLWAMRVTFSRSAIVRHWTLAGVGRSVTRPYHRISRIELRPDRSADGEEEQPRPLQASVGRSVLASPAANVILAFVDEQGQDVTTIDGLTRTEARWVAALFVSRLPRAYQPARTASASS